MLKTYEICTVFMHGLSWELFSFMELVRHKVKDGRLSSHVLIVIYFHKYNGLHIIK